MISLADAIALTTEDEELTALLADMKSSGADAAGFSPFSVSATLPTAMARALAHERETSATIARAGFLDLLTGLGVDEWIDKIVKAWFGVTRIPATKAKGLFKVTAAAGGGATVLARELVADAGAGTLFDNTTGFTINGGTTLFREFECRTPGITGNVLPGAITGFQIGKPGLTVTNESGWITLAGRDKERNADLVARGRAKFPAKAVGGSRDAYLVWVAEAFEAIGLDSSITKIGIDDTNPNGPGSTDIYLANAAGPATSTELGIVDGYLQPRRGLGTGTLRVLAAPVLTQPVIAVLYVDNNANALAEATSRLQAFQADFPLGGGKHGMLFTDQIEGALLGPDGVVGVYKVDLSSPSTDVALGSPFQTLVLSLSLSVA